eukprot:4797981-Amphidinium_carterae.1
MEIWPSVKQELRIFDAIACLIQQDLSSEWSPDVVMVDASPSGLGAVASRLPVDTVADLGR